jgi:hypothetical protein
LWISRAQSVEVARPRLHHSSTLRQTLRAIVGAAAFVPFCMRELQLDQIWVPALLVEMARC